MNPIKRIKDCFAQPSPKRVMLQFIGVLLGIQLLALLLGQLNVPGYGDTVWSLVGSAFFAVCNLLPIGSAGMADNYAFVVGALAVLSLVNIHFVSCRSGEYQPGPLDILLALMAAWLFGVFYAYQDRTMPFNSSFFYRVSIFSAWAVVAVGVSGLLSYLADKLDDEVYLGAILVFFGSAIGTGMHGAQDATVPWFSFQVVNGVLQLVANFGGLVVWLIYEEQMSQAKKSYTPAEPLQGNISTDCI